MNRAEDLRRVTHLFPTFLGLRLVPVGVLFVIVGLAAPLVGWIATGPRALLALAAAAAIWPIHRWYRREYGVVEPEKLGLGRNWIILAGLVVALGVLGLGVSRVGDESRLVLLMVLVFFATVALWALPRAFGSGRLLPGAVAVLAVVGAALFVIVARDSARFASIGSLFSLVVGVLLCLAGWIEHRQMTRAMERLGAGEDV